MSWSSITRAGRAADLPEPAAAGSPAAGDHIGSEAEIAAAEERRRRRRRLIVWGARVVTFVVVFGGWQLLTDAKIVDPFFWGKPSGIVSTIRDWVDHGTEFGSLWQQVWTTMKEALLGFVYGVIAGVVVGVLLGQSRLLSDVLSPYIKVVNAIPRIVVGTLFTVAFGIGTTSKVTLAAVLVFFGVFFNAYQGVREVDRNLIDNARVLGASRLEVTRHVVLPSAMTWIIASLHIAFGFAIIGAVVGEVLGAQHGLGLVIYTSMNTFRPDGVFAGMFIIAAIALVAEGLITALEKRILGWRPPAQSESAAA
ncbi:MAG TPA: ABC transporter permease [Solirubrobacteraceae bacterium]|nr:ABC transporter permease [Solirubrobacteraceae bacterium]